MEDKFRYEPLRHPFDIRLAVLHPNSERSPAGIPDITLYSCTLSDVQGQYVALSYLWGNQKTDHNVRLNGRSFQVTKNLLFFLQRPRKDPTTVWVDAICINQEDWDEKAVQIPLMGQIYENADEVYAELGPGTDAEQILLKKMRRSWAVVLDRISDTLRATHERSNYVDPMSLPFIDPRDGSFWTVVDEFVAKPFWSRAWILQEVTAKPNKTKIFLGSESLWFNDIMAMALAAKSPQRWAGHENPQTQANPVSRLISISDFRSRPRETNNFLYILEQSRGHHASHKCDLIYSLLSLAKEIPPGTIVPSYHKSFAEVTFELAVYYLKTMEVPLDILGYSGGPVERDDSENFPSWLPQWDVEYPRAIFKKTLLSRKGRVRRIYSACGKNRISYPAGVRIDGQTLCTAGFTIGKIATLTAPSTVVTASRGAEIISKWAPSPKEQLDIYIGGGYKGDAFLHTLVADVDPILRLEFFGQPDEHASHHRHNFARWDYPNGKLDAPDTPMATYFSYGDVHRATYYPQYRRLAWTDTGYVALVPHNAKIGDAVFVLIGGSMLYALREKGPEFSFVGECYVHHMMYGQAVDLIIEEAVTVQEVRIV